MKALTFRPAHADEAVLVADIVFGAPDQLGRQVMSRIYELADLEPLRPLFRRIWRDSDNWSRTTLAVDGNEVVGVIQLGSSKPRVTIGAGWLALRTFRWRTLKLWRGMQLHGTVSVPPPAGALLLSELHVAPGRRGEGIGSELLNRVDAIARERGYSAIALQTYVTNPARRLYERHGYCVFDQKLDEEFARVTGVGGNVGYVKHLTAQPD